MIEAEFTLIVRNTDDDTVLDKRVVTIPLIQNVTASYLHIPPEVLINSVRQIIDSMRQDHINSNPVALAILEDIMKRFEFHARTGYP